MRTQAAVLWGAKQDWKIETIDLGDPVRHEVRVKLAASGLCHSDEHVVTGDAHFEHFPLVGGHEGAGVVEAVGPGVETLAVGDHVVLSWIPSCGRCRPCVLGWQNLCENGAALLTGKALADGTNRIHVGGQPATAFCMLGTFAQHVVVTAVAPTAQQEISCNLTDLTFMEKQLRGALYGSENPRTAVPKLLGLYRRGELKLDEMITRTYTLDEINQGYADMRAGKNIRGVIVFD
jgi:Zn-dependent alcohol dehydrogenase